MGLLRDHGDSAGADRIRTETLAGITGLISEVIAGGQDVGFTVIGPSNGLPLGTGIGPLAQLAAYRMVQESLANAGRHAAGARCEVEIDDRDQAAMVVLVRNARSPRTPDPGLRGGLGLVGMRERTELTGSHLDVGPAPDGGWQVRLRTPRADADTDPDTGVAS